MIKFNAFVFQQYPLQIVVTGAAAQTDATTGINHPMPWYFVAIIQRRQCITDLAGMPRKTGKPGNLTIGGNAALRYAAHNPVNLIVGKSSCSRHDNVPNCGLWK